MFFMYRIETISKWFFFTNNSWYPELVFLTVMFSYGIDLAVVISYSTVKIKLFYSQTSWKPYQRLIFAGLLEKLHNFI